MVSFTCTVMIDSLFFLCTCKYDHRSPDQSQILKPKPSPNEHQEPAVIKKNEKNRSPNLVGFNETLYLLTAPRDADAYKKNAFNQEESDKLPSDRLIPDSRNRV